ncbi:hypothetical protein PWG14_10980 (plasmid) [Chromobacterium amazonense]|uniref:hypothetical protein n=1 Tax=Chromobacterium amazonense TaxID=1382803 RepID=UPI00237E8AB2|nr:hypothetical protein [Chromobacterium amazonense]MDE1713135.1 hypothetical protein [Chromobacterium amazonense]
MSDLPNIDLSQKEESSLPNIDLNESAGDQGALQTNKKPNSERSVYVETARSLTVGEVALCKIVFADTINYELVKVHNSTYLPARILPENRQAPMTPSGEIYYPVADDRYRQDYSARNYVNYKGHVDELGSGGYIEVQHTFIHEMVHVWQHQHGEMVKIKGLLLHTCHALGVCSNPYPYLIEDDKVWQDYSLEQRAEMVANYFVLLKYPGNGHAYNKVSQNDLGFSKWSRDFVSKVKAGDSSIQGESEASYLLAVHDEIMAEYKRVLNGFPNL